MIEQEDAFCLSDILPEVYSARGVKGRGGWSAAKENQRGRKWASHPEEASFILQGNCITY